MPTCTSHFSTAPFAAAGRMRVTSGTTSPSIDTMPLMSPLASKLRVIASKKSQCKGKQRYRDDALHGLATFKSAGPATSIYNASSILQSCVNQMQSHTPQAVDALEALLQVGLHAHRVLGFRQDLQHLVVG